MPLKLTDSMASKNSVRLLLNVAVACSVFDWHIGLDLQGRCLPLRKVAT